MNYPPLQITFLGTGTSGGVPMIGCNCGVCFSKNPKDKRLRSSIKITSPEKTIVIDTTPDFRYQMLRSKTNRLDAIIFTHPHKDHIGGLDDIRAYNHFMNQPMDLYVNKLTEDSLRREFYYAFDETQRFKGVPEFIIHPIEKDNFTIGDMEIEPIKVWHHRMPVLGFRFGNFTYITDANKIDQIEKEKIKGSEILVLNALRREPHLSHFTLEEAIKMALELEVPRVYFTHISHQLGLHDDVEAELPKGIHLAYDGLVISGKL